ncbi:MAG TPA: hypothetical protein VI874_04355, partial [Candidatus Norongarragalinales archaeon]|nr:hypothetical protein [Candidatus Norongarragalinales archaeon]
PKKNVPLLKDVLSWLQKKAKNKPVVEQLILILRPLGQQSFINRKSTLRLDDVFDENLVDIDLTGLPTDGIRSLLALSLLQFCRERMRKSSATEEKRLERFVVLDEAWKICGSEGDPSVIVREGRKHGLGLIVATQNPQDISPTILSNAASLFMFRTPHAASLDALQSSMGFPDPFRSKLAGLPVGVPAVHLQWVEGFSHTFFLARVDGESLMDACLFEVNRMTWTMEKEKLLSWFSKHGLSKKVQEWICNKGYSCDAADFCLFLEENRLTEEVQTRFFHDLGLSKDQIDQVFCSKRLRSFGPKTRVADVEVV